MGEVEQMRKAASSGAKVDLSFRRDDAVERALVRDVQTAWGNLIGYLSRAREEETASA